MNKKYKNKGIIARKLLSLTLYFTPSLCIHSSSQTRPPIHQRQDEQGTLSGYFQINLITQKAVLNKKTDKKMKTHKNINYHTKLCWKMKVRANKEIADMAHSPLHSTPLHICLSFSGIINSMTISFDVFLLDSVFANFIIMLFSFYSGRNKEKSHVNISSGELRHTAAKISKGHWDAIFSYSK